MSSSPVSAILFVSLGEILSLNCFVDLIASGRYRSWEYCNVSVDKVCTWPVAPLVKRNDSDDFPDTVIIGSSALYPLAKGAIQILIIIITTGVSVYLF